MPASPRGNEIAMKTLATGVDEPVHVVLSAALPPVFTAIALTRMSQIQRQIELAAKPSEYQMNKEFPFMLSLAVLFALVSLLALPAPAQSAGCSGCLCPGNPCGVCALPPVKDAAPIAGESDTCRKIRETVAAVSKNTEPNEYYASKDKSIQECVRNGGDVIINSSRSKEFPSRHYCKPYNASPRSSAEPVSPRQN